MKTIVEKVEEYIKEKHKDQKRWDGSSYYDNHLVLVRDLSVKLVKEKYNNLFFTKQTSDQFIDVVSIVALAHDLAEDQNVSEDEFGKWLYNQGDLDLVIVEDIVESLKRLNKNYYDTYLDFVLGSKGFLVSRIVKIADITNNSSTLKKGSMLDKYKLALYILKND